MFLCSSALWALDVAVLNISIRSYFIDDIELPFSERVSRGRRRIALFSRVQDVIYSFEVRTLSEFPNRLFVRPYLLFVSVQVRVW